MRCVHWTERGSAGRRKNWQILRVWSDVSLGRIASPIQCRGTNTTHWNDYGKNGPTPSEHIGLPLVST